MVLLGASAFLQINGANYNPIVATAALALALGTLGGSLLIGLALRRGQRGWAVAVVLHALRGGVRLRKHG